MPNSDLWETFGLLICTLISENQGFEKIKVSFKPYKKFQALKTGNFFSVCHLVLVKVLQGSVPGYLFYKFWGRSNSCRNYFSVIRGCMLMEMYYSHYLFVFCTLGNFNIIPHALRLFSYRSRWKLFYFVHENIYHCLLCHQFSELSSGGFRKRSERERDSLLLGFENLMTALLLWKFQIDFEPSW